MNKLAELKARAAVARQRLKAVHDSREEDSRVIIDMWSQIREKFEVQNVELGVYRGKIATLEANNRELSDFLGTLLSTINGAVDGEAIETVSGITAMATELLDAPSGESVGAVAEPPKIPPVMDLDTEARPTPCRNTGKPVIDATNLGTRTLKPIGHDRVPSFHKRFV